MNYLVIRREEEIKRVYLDEISVLIIENTGCSLTSSLLEALINKKIDVVFCDSKRNPLSQLIPFSSRFEANAQLFSQVNWTEESKSNAWAEIIRQKIKRQADNLRRFDEKIADKLLSYVPEIEPGDPTNREGHAAKVYFNAIFYPGFSRDDNSTLNAALNYGYAVILSYVNRQIVSCGYFTQFGLFHKNTFNQFNLGCDLMEPFRPLVDKIVKENFNERFDGGMKVKLVDVLNHKVRIKGKDQYVSNAISIYVKSVFNAIDKKDVDLINFFEYEL